MHLSWTTHSQIKYVLKRIYIKLLITLADVNKELIWFVGQYIVRRNYRSSSKGQSSIPYIFINDLFFFITQSHVCNFADDSTLYSYDENLPVIFQSLKCDFRNVLNWFKINSLNANLEKFQFMILGRNISDSCILNTDGKKIPSTQVKLLTTNVPII